VNIARGLPSQQAEHSNCNRCPLVDGLLYIEEMIRTWDRRARQKWGAIIRFSKRNKKFL